MGNWYAGTDISWEDHARNPRPEAFDARLPVATRELVGSRDALTRTGLSVSPEAPGTAPARGGDLPPDTLTDIAAPTAAQLAAGAGEPVERITGTVTGLRGAVADLSGTVEAGFARIEAGMEALGSKVDNPDWKRDHPDEAAAYGFFRKAREADLRGMPDICQEFLLRSAEKAPDDWRFQDLRGRVLLPTDPAGAEGAFTKAAAAARSAEPREAALALCRGAWAAYVRFQMARAVALFERAVEIDPDLVEARYLAARAHLATAAFDLAFRHLRTAVESDAGYLARAAADGAFAQHPLEFARFARRLRDEALARLREQVRPALADPAAAEGGRLAGATRVIRDRWRAIAEGGAALGALDLLSYEREGLAADRAEFERLKGAAGRAEARGRERAALLDDRLGRPHGHPDALAWKTRARPVVNDLRRALAGGDLDPALRAAEPAWTDYQAIVDRCRVAAATLERERAGVRQAMDDARTAIAAARERVRYPLPVTLPAVAVVVALGVVWRARVAAAHHASVAPAALVGGVGALVVALAVLALVAFARYQLATGEARAALAERSGRLASLDTELATVAHPTLAD